MRGSATALLFGLAIALAAAGAAPAAPKAEAAETYDSARTVLVLFRLPPAHFAAGANYSDSYGGELGRNARRRIALALAREQGLTLVTDWPIPLAGVDCYVMRVPEGRSPETVAQVLSNDRRVAWAEPMNLYRPRAAQPPNDPLYPAQPAAQQWRLADLHEVATGVGVRVAVIDSMVDEAHPDLAGRVRASRNFAPGPAASPEQHGTAVAGVIAARSHNGQGIVGVAPDAGLMALRACWQQPGQQGAVCDSLSLAKALSYAIDNRAQVINLSLSGPPAPILGRLLDVALSRGAVVVGAFDAEAPGGGFPASHRGVVAVSDGQAPEGVYRAPGRDVVTTLPGGRWSMVSGSSYSAAHVSGLFALLRQRTPRGPVAPLLAARADGMIDTCATLLGAGPCGCACAHAKAASTLRK